MNEKEIKISKLKYIIAGASVILASISISLSAISNYVNADVGEVKDDSQIALDAKNLGANMDMIKKSDFGYARLLFKQDQPVYVKYDINMPTKEIDVIENTVNYYNNIFQSINDEYKFEMVDETFENTNESIIITFKNVDLSKDNYGINHSIHEYRITKGYFVVESEINIDWEKTQNLNDTCINYIFVHEFAHTLGLNDVYLDINGYENNNTIMNVENINLIDVIYPSDYIILQSLYSNEYKKHETYQDSIDIIKDKIELYKENFYEYFSIKLHEKYEEIEHLNNKYLEDLNLSWETTNYTFNIKKKDNLGILEVMDKNNNIIEITKGNLFYKEGIFFIDDLEFESKNYLKHNNQNNKCLFNLVIYKTKTGDILINDNCGSYPFIANEIKIIKR